MTDQKPASPPWIAVPLPRPPHRPQLRCPACASVFTPPAAICPACRADLRLGRRRKRRLWLKIPPQIRRPLKKIVTVVMMLALITAGYGGVRGYLQRPPAMPAEAPRAPDSFQRLAGEYPVLLRPYVIMYKTRAAVEAYRDNLGYRQRFMEELAKASSEVSLNGASDETLTMSRRLTQGQRLKMLKDLLAVTAPPGENPPDDRELMKKTLPAEAARELKKLDKATAGQ